MATYFESITGTGRDVGRVTAAILRGEVWQDGLPLTYPYVTETDGTIRLNDDGTKKQITASTRVETLKTYIPPLNISLVLLVQAAGSLGQAIETTVGKELHAVLATATVDKDVVQGNNLKGVYIFHCLNNYFVSRTKHGHLDMTLVKRFMTMRPTFQEPFAAYMGRLHDAAVTAFGGQDKISLTTLTCMTGIANLPEPLYTSVKESLLADEEAMKTMTQFIATGSEKERLYIPPEKRRKLTEAAFAAIPTETEIIVTEKLTETELAFAAYRESNTSSDRSRKSPKKSPRGLTPQCPNCKSIKHDLNACPFVMHPDLYEELKKGKQFTESDNAYRTKWKNWREKANKRK